MEDDDYFDLDYRLLSFGETLRQKTDLSVSVDEDLLIIGTGSDCALVSKSEEFIRISFHRLCHPSVVLSCILSLLEHVSLAEIKILPSFICDVRGIVTYEAEVGFSLVYFQYLRDLLGGQKLLSS